MTVAALYVERGGAYYDLPGVDPWGLPDKDATLYAGPHPVVAHPPCSRWCRLAGLVEARWGHKRGDDGGTFAAALAAVQRWGGGIGASCLLGCVGRVRSEQAANWRRVGQR